MNAYEKNQLLALQAEKYGINLNPNQAQILRRASMTLQRWHELECGTDSGYIEQDGNSGKWFFTPSHNHDIKWVISDREKGALKRIEAVCKDAGCFFYVQGDPRGNALYISNEPMTAGNYYRGLAV